MSKLVINNLPKNEELDRQALAEFKGGIDPSSLFAQIKAEAAGAASAFPLDQEPELGVSANLTDIQSLSNQPFTPHSV